ncbi:MAG: hypothetical protein AB8C13_01835 [Phycisphaerales bacterium]
MKRRSTPQLIGAAALCFALALIIAAIPTVVFVQTFINQAAKPIAEFPSNQPFEFVDDTPYSSYYLSIQVLDRDADLPEMTTLITNKAGEEIVGEPRNRWSSMMGRQYKRFLKIDQQNQGPLNFSVNTPQPQTLLIFRKVEDVSELALNKALPLWIISLLPLLAMVALLGIVLVRAINASSTVNMKISD